MAVETAASSAKSEGLAKILLRAAAFLSLTSSFIFLSSFLASYFSKQ